MKLPTPQLPVMPKFVLAPMITFVIIYLSWVMAAMIGYVAFLAGPPLLGLISEQFGLLQTLLILVVLIVLSGLFSGAARPIAGSKVGAGHH